MAKSESIIFNGIKFNRYPESKHKTHQRYFNPPHYQRAKGIEALHREIWKFYNGEIPKGWHVHHKDGNYLNNDISNLEAISPEQHRAEHKDNLIKSLKSDERREHLKRIQGLSKEWHKSEEGRKWHSQQAKISAEKRLPKEFVCAFCGITFLSKNFSKNSERRFCTSLCCERLRIKEQRRKKEKTCVYCLNPFIGDSRAQTCSRVCGSRNRWRKAKV